MFPFPVISFSAEIWGPFLEKINASVTARKQVTMYMLPSISHPETVLEAELRIWDLSEGGASEETSLQWPAVKKEKNAQEIVKARMKGHDYAIINDEAHPCVIGRLMKWSSQGELPFTTGGRWQIQHRTSGMIKMKLDAEKTS